MKENTVCDLYLCLYIFIQTEWMDTFKFKCITSNNSAYSQDVCFPVSFINTCLDYNVGLAQSKVVLSSLNIPKVWEIRHTRRFLWDGGSSVLKCLRLCNFSHSHTLSSRGWMRGRYVEEGKLPTRVRKIVFHARYIVSGELLSKCFNHMWMPFFHCSLASSKQQR